MTDQTEQTTLVHNEEEAFALEPIDITGKTHFLSPLYMKSEDGNLKEMVPQSLELELYELVWHKLYSWHCAITFSLKVVIPSVYIK